LKDNIRISDKIEEYSRYFYISAVFAILLH